MKESKATLITAHIRDGTANNSKVVTTLRIPLFNMNKADGLKVKDALELNPYVGLVTVHLDNGMHV